MWVLALSVVVFAITLKQRVFYVVLGASFVVYAICYALIRGREKKKGSLTPPL